MSTTNRTHHSFHGQTRSDAEDKADTRGLRHTVGTDTRRRGGAKVAVALLALMTFQATAAFAEPARKVRAEKRVERAVDHRGERRDDRQDFRGERRDDRQDFREDRREDRQDFREDRRDDRHRHVHSWRHHRWDRWDDWLDYRRTVATARLVAGMIFATLPPEHTVIIIGGSTYYVHDDVYFVKVHRNGLTSYEVVDEPTVVIID
ncbi:MAG: DUF6515 family protein [Acidobacteriota bacterium]